jgi:hypothetical protein
LLCPLIGNTNSYGLSAWWTPEESGWIPSISTGWGLTDIPTAIAGVKSATTQSWYVGLEWDDVFLEGNSFGMAVGQPTFITDIDEAKKGATTCLDLATPGNSSTSSRSPTTSRLPQQSIT